MSDINLLKDRKSAENRPKKKKAGLSGVELTTPPKEKDEIKKKIKGGGVLEFFKSLFRKKPKKELPKQISKKKEEPAKKERTGPLDKLFHTSLKKGEEGEKKKKTIPEPKKTDSNQPPAKFPHQEPEKRKLSPKRPFPQKIDPFRSAQPDKKPEEKTTAENIPPEEKAGSLGVNLIPEDVLVKLEPKTRLKQLGLAVGIIVIVTGFSYGYLIYRQSKIKGRAEDVQKEIASVQQEIISFESIKKEASSLNKKAGALTKVLNSHVYWSQFFAYLEQYTLPNVYYTNLAGDTMGRVTLTAKAQNLKTLSDQYVIFQNAEDFVESVSIESAVNNVSEENKESVDFSISLTIKPEIFYKKL